MNKPHETPYFFRSYGKITILLGNSIYIAPFALAVFLVVVLFYDFKSLTWFNIFQGLLVTVSYIYLSYKIAQGLVKTGKSLQDGRQSAGIGLLIITLFVAALSGLTAFIRHAQSGTVPEFWVALTICVISILAFFALFVALLKYWKRLNPEGINLYD